MVFTLNGSVCMRNCDCDSMVTVIKILYRSLLSIKTYDSKQFPSIILHTSQSAMAQECHRSQVSRHTHTQHLLLVHSRMYIHSHCTSKCESKKINAMNQSIELRSVYIVGTLVSTSLTHKPCIRHEYENFERKSSPFLSCQEKSKCTYG